VKKNAAHVTCGLSNYSQQKAHKSLQIANYRTFTMDPPEVVPLVLARQLHEAALERMKEVLQSRQVDRTVSRECIKYITFVDANGLKSGNTYMNRLAADLYFTRVLVNWNGQLHDKSYHQFPPMFQ
jgi:hypothetical protein